MCVLMLSTPIGTLKLCAFCFIFVLLLIPTYESPVVELAGQVSVTSMKCASILFFFFRVKYYK